MKDEFFKVCRQGVCWWKEVIFVGEDGLEAHQVPTKHVLLGQVIDARKVISTLVWLHVLEELHGDWAIEPCDIPLSILSFGQMILKVEFGNFFDYIVMSPQRVHHHTICLEGDLLRSQVILIVIFITRSEPIRIVRRIGIAGVIVGIVRNFYFAFQFRNVAACCFLSLLSYGSSFVII